MTSGMTEESRRNCTVRESSTPHKAWKLGRDRGRETCRPGRKQSWRLVLLPKLNIHHLGETVQWFPPQVSPSCIGGRCPPCWCCPSAWWGTPPWPGPTATWPGSQLSRLDMARCHRMWRGDGFWRETWRLGQNTWGMFLSGSWLLLSASSPSDPKQQTLVSFLKVCFVGGLLRKVIRWGRRYFKEIFCI